MQALLKNMHTCYFKGHSRIGSWSTQNFMAKPYTGMFIPYGQSQQTRQPLQSEPFVSHVHRHHLLLAYMLGLIFSYCSVKENDSLFLFASWTTVCNGFWNWRHPFLFTHAVWFPTVVQLNGVSGDQPPSTRPGLLILHTFLYQVILIQFGSVFNVYIPIRG